MAGVTKSLESDEFVIHLKKDFDYRLISQRKEEVIDCIKMSYISAVKKNLSVFGVKHKDLGKFTTSEKDVEKGKSWIPDDKFKLNSENVLQESSSDEEEVKKLSKQDRNPFMSQSEILHNRMTNSLVDESSL